MKNIRFIVIFLILIVSCSLFYEMRGQDTSIEDDEKKYTSISGISYYVYNDANLHNLEDSGTFSDSYVLHFQEENLHIKEGDFFDYFGPIKDTNGVLPSVNAAGIAAEKGKYIIVYPLYEDDTMQNIVNTYYKVLYVE